MSCSAELRGTTIGQLSREAPTLDPKQLKAIKKSAQRERWSAVGVAVGVLYEQAAGNPIDIIRIKSLVPVIQKRNGEDLCWAVDELLRLQKQSQAK